MGGAGNPELKSYTLGQEDLFSFSSLNVCKFRLEIFYSDLLLCDGCLKNNYMIIFFGYRYLICRAS